MANKLIRDPELEQLVKQLNRDTPRSSRDNDDPIDDDATAPQFPPAILGDGNPFERLLIEMAQRGASDLLVVAGMPPVLRVSGRLVRTDRETLDGDDIATLFSTMLTSALRERIDTHGSADFSLRLARAEGDEDRRAWRFRVNVHRQRGSFAAAVRALPSAIPTLP